MNEARIWRRFARTDSNLFIPMVQKSTIEFSQNPDRANAMIIETVAAVQEIVARAAEERVVTRPAAQLVSKP